MTDTTEYLSQSVKRCIDDHLGAIDDTLGNSGFSQSERQSILDDVEAQIHDMLIDRAQGEPTVEDARAVLAEMDPPESYASEENPPLAVGKNQDDGLFVSGKQALWISVGIYVSIFLFFGFTAFLMIKVYGSSASVSEFAWKTISWYSVLFVVVGTAIVFVYTKFVYLKHEKKTTGWAANWVPESGKLPLWLSVGIYVLIFLLVGFTVFLNSQSQTYRSSPSISDLALKTITWYSVLFLLIGTAIMFVYTKYVQLKQKKKTIVCTTNNMTGFENMTVFEKKVLYSLLCVLALFSVCYLVFSETWAEDFFSGGIYFILTIVTLIYPIYCVRKRKKGSE